MKIINHGKYEILTTRVDAINKFMQLQGVCRGEISGQNAIEFYCQKNGKITITNPPTRRAENDNSTNLFAEILEEDGKTYVSYYTAFSKSSNVLKIILLVTYLLIAIFAVAVTIIGRGETYYLPILVLGLALFGTKLFAGAKEEKNFPKDSEILINELEKRVEAVNLWDK
ncbi:MAG: hypothetical protein E7552_03280 [Ruminococcaceae bacterium]|nr:hypothetical protein [Oscillospiraceae bacterium]